MAIIVRTGDTYEAYQSVELLSNLGIKLARRDEFCTDPNWAMSFECDELIAPLIVKLNNMGFKTKACCSGHAYPAITANESFHSDKGFQYWDDEMISNGYIYFVEDNAFIGHLRNMHSRDITIDEERPIVRWDIPDDILDNPMKINVFNMDIILQLYSVATMLDNIKCDQPEESEKKSDHLRDLFECSLEEKKEILDFMNNLGKNTTERFWCKIFGDIQREMAKKEEPDTAEYWWKMLVDHVFHGKETLEWLEKALKNLENE